MQFKAFFKALMFQFVLINLCESYFSSSVTIIFHFGIKALKLVLTIRICWIRIQGAKYQPKTATALQLKEQILDI